MSKRKASQISKEEMVVMIVALRDVLFSVRDDWDCDATACRHEIKEVLDRTHFRNDLNEHLDRYNIPRTKIIEEQSVRDIEESDPVEMLRGAFAPAHTEEELKQRKADLEVYIDEMCKKCGGSGKVPADNPADHAMFDPNSPDYLAYGKAGGMTTCRDCGGSGSRRKA